MTLPLEKPASRRRTLVFAAGLSTWLAATGLLTYSYAGAAPNALPGAAVQQATPPANTAQAQAGLSYAAQLSDAFAQVAESVSPSVVTIKVESKKHQPAMRMPFFGFNLPNGGQ